MSISFFFCFSTESFSRGQDSTPALQGWVDALSFFINQVVVVLSHFLCWWSNGSSSVVGLLQIFAIFFSNDYFQANIPISFSLFYFAFHLLHDLCLRKVCGLVFSLGYLCLIVLASDITFRHLMKTIEFFFSFCLFACLFSVNVSMKSFPLLFDFIPSYHAIL